MPKTQQIFTNKATEARKLDRKLTIGWKNQLKPNNFSIDQPNKTEKNTLNTEKTNKGHELDRNNNIY